MMMRRESIVILSTLILSSCDLLKKELHSPDPEDFRYWFQWFVELFIPNNLTNQERIVFMLLILIVSGAVVALINSERALNFFKELPFQNRFLRVLFISPTFLLFPLRGIKHPGWALGIWVFLRCLYLCVLLILSFIVLFYLAVILPYIIITIIITISIVIYERLSGSYK